MGDFKRISECEDPLEVLNTPMEPGLVPFPSYWDGGWGDNFTSEVMSAAPASNFASVEGELFERFTQALRTLRRENFRSDPVNPDDFDVLLDPLSEQRMVLAAAVQERFTGTNAQFAIAAHRLETSYERLSPKRKTQWDIIQRQLVHGYRPPLPPAQLVMHGTRPAPRWSKTDLASAKMVAHDVLSGTWTTEAIEAELTATSKRRKRPYRSPTGAEHVKSGIKLAVDVRDLEKVWDGMKNRSLYPWPEGIFDSGLRYFLLLQAASSAFRRAYDEFFVWQNVEVVRSGGQWMISHPTLRASLT